MEPLSESVEARCMECDGPAVGEDVTGLVLCVDCLGQPRLEE
jgi:hypothetical protein